MDTLAIDTAFRQTIDGMARCDALKDLKKVNFSPLLSAFMADSLIVFRQRMEGYQQELIPVAGHNQDESLLNQYLRNLSDQDPSIEYWRSVSKRPRHFWRLSDLDAQSRTAKARPFLRFLHKEANVGPMLMMSFNTGLPSSDSLVMAFRRKSGDRDFDNQTLGYAGNFSPAVHQIVRGLASGETTLPDIDTIQTLIAPDSNSKGALTDGNLRVLGGNEHACKVLQDLPASLRARIASRIREFLANGDGTQTFKMHALGQFGSFAIGVMRIDPLDRAVLVNVNDLRLSRERNVDRLSPRQLEVAKLVASGFRNWQVAEQLGISEKTVVNHLSAIYEAIGVGSRTELALRWNSMSN